jgi:purine-nucleoside phosphorylase
MGAGYEAVAEAVAFLQAQGGHKPLIGIICGSGLGGLADLVADAIAIGYERIPNFPVSTGARAAAYTPLLPLAPCP